MYRYAIKSLECWKSSPYRKPLIVQGARQVGKTWLMKEFGRTAYDDTAYINFDGNEMMSALFTGDMDVRRILSGLELYLGRKIVPGKTLLVFDEVQEVPKALASLKYFCENAPEFHIVCAGSLLGLALHPNTSFPVGKVDFLRLGPLTFTEFLMAAGKTAYAEAIDDGDFTAMAPFHVAYVDALKRYYFVGGMPEAVSRYVQGDDMLGVREVQRRILMAYEQDFSKHAPNDVVPKIRMVWNSVPAQLARENRKFTYGLVRQGARARDLETAIMWLSDCGLVHRVTRITAPRLPLRAYEDPKAFKLYMLDVGLLSCMSGLRGRTLLDGNALFTEFKGALTEQYVLQQLKAQGGMDVHYYTNDRGSCEVDFVIDDGETVVPMEVKAEENLRSKSLAAFREKFSPGIAVRTSMSPYREQEGLVNIPLYAVGALPGVVRRLVPR